MNEAVPKVVAQQRHGRGSNPRPLDRKSDALPFSHRATPILFEEVVDFIVVAASGLWSRVARTGLHSP